MLDWLKEKLEKRTFETESFIIPPALYDAIAAAQGGPFVQKASASEMSKLFPLSAALRRAELAREEAAKNCGTLIGQWKPLGQWKPQDGDRKDIGMVFNVYAAPHDLTFMDDIKTPQRFTYEQVMRRIGELENWYGHAGIAYASQETLIWSLINYRYKGEWIVPTLEMAEFLYLKHDATGLKDTFVAATALNNPIHESWYWSCSVSLYPPRSFECVSFASGNVMDADERIALNCRPVRLELVK